MSDFAEKFRRVPLFLERVGIIRGSHNVDCVRNQFPFLPFALRSDQRASRTDRCASTEPLHICVVWQCVLRDDLKIAKGRAVIQLDKRKIFGIAPRPHPALNLNCRDGSAALQSILDRGRRTRFIHTFKQTFNAQHPTFNCGRFALRKAPLGFLHARYRAAREVGVYKN
jgi:hypothetical protein